MQHMIDKWSAALDQVEQQLRVLSTKPRELLTQRPDPKAWSIVEVVEHLNKTSDAYIPLIRGGLLNCLDGKDAEFQMGFIQKWFIGFVRPENTMKVPTIKMFNPAKQLDPDEVFEMFYKRQEMFREILKGCANKRINATRFGSPATPLLRFTVAEALELQVNHQLRHLGQIMRVADHVGA